MTAQPMIGPTGTINCSRRRSPLGAKSLDATKTLVEAEPPLIFPLQGDPSEYAVQLAPESHLETKSGKHEGSTTVSGTIGLAIDETTCDASGRCDFVMTTMNARAENFTLERCRICQSFDVADLGVILSGGPFKGTITADGTFDFVQDVVWVEVSGTADDADFVLPVVAKQGFTGHFDRSTGAFSLVATFSNSEGTVDLDLHGTMVNHPPIALIDGPTQVECGVPPTYSAARSSDPDGGALAGYAWIPSASIGSGALSGTEARLALPPGEHGLGLAVTDATGLDAYASISISVDDTLQPTLEGPGSVALERCLGSTEVLIGPATAYDVCDGDLPVTARLVERDGLATDIGVALGDSVALGPDSTVSIEYATSDSSGNATVVTQTIATYRGASCCPPSPGQSRSCAAGTPGDDTFDAGNGGDWYFGGGGDDAIRGGNGPDALYGGLGDDSLEGMNGPDKLWGSAGDDRLDGGAGPDEIEGGAGVDVILGGHGPDRIWLRSSCHALAGEVIDGGEGYDILYSPLSSQELEAMGVVVRGIEEVVMIEDEGGCDA